MQKCRVAIAGLAPRGMQHADAFLASADGFDLVAVCDLDVERLSKPSARLNASPATYTDAAEMLSRHSPDVFCFCTQPDVRTEHGVKAIAFEKPMAMTLAEP